MKNSLKFLSLLCLLLVLAFTACVAEETKLPDAPEDAPFEWSLAHTALVTLLVVAVPLVTVEVLDKYQTYKGRAEIWLEAKELDEIVKLAVQTAEAMGIRQLLQEEATAKFNYACTVIQNFLDARSIPLKVNDYMPLIRGLIEKAVLELYPPDAKS